MDIMNLLSSAPLVGNVAQLTGNGSSAVDGAVFQKQLMGIVDAQTTTLDNSATTANQAILLANSSMLLAAEEMTGDELEGMIEHLLDQLDELNEQNLDVEQQDVIESILQQVMALVELVSVSNHQAKVTLQNLYASHHQTEQTGYFSNDALVKLGDQLLLLQQALQSGTSKVLFGKSAEGVVTEQLQVIAAKVDELMHAAKLKQGEAATQVLPTANAESTDQKSSGDAASHLQRLAQQAPQTAHASQATDTSSTATTAATSTASAESTNAQTAIPEFQLRADNVRDFFLQMNRSAAGTSSAYVLADEFADTMKELIVQRFNVTSLNGITEARLSLTPEHLGHVDVKISMQNGVMTAIFSTETAMAKDALENQMIHLRASLAAQGITVEKIEVAQTQFASELSQQHKQGSSTNQHGNDDSNSREKEQTFEEELLSNVTNQELGFGRSVNEIV